MSIMTECKYSLKEQSKCDKFIKSNHHPGCMFWRKELNHCDNIDIQERNKE